MLVARGDGNTGPRKTGRLTADQLGFSLHAATHVHARDTRGRAALCRYILRPPLANDRLTSLPDGRVRISLQKAYRDGTTAVELAPLAFMARLAAIIPAPRLHIVRYHGVLAPRSRLRPQIVPGRRRDGDSAGGTSVAAASAATDGGAAPAHTVPSATDEASKAPAGRRYLPWADLLKRTPG